MTTTEDQTRGTGAGTSLLLIGAGRMGGALLDGWLDASLLEAAHVRVADPDADRRQGVAARGATVAADAGELLKGDGDTDIVVVAVKPQVLERVLTPLAGMLSGKLVVSIAAGLPLARLQAVLPEARLVRAMPNQPVTVGRGATGLTAGDAVTQIDRSLVHRLFTAVGTAVWVEDEALMHAVTGLSGSGPAFVAMVAEALEDAGVDEGLDRATARALALQTLEGAAAQILESGAAPVSLKEAVTSPGGTTIAGVRAAESAGLRTALLDAVAAAARRSRELAEG